MKAVFADTFYFLALLNEQDAAHSRAVDASKAPEQSFVTTEFVLLELGDALSKPPLREEFKAVCALIQSLPSFRVVPCSRELLHRGLSLYHEAVCPEDEKRIQNTFGTGRNPQEHPFAIHHGYAEK